MQSDEIVLPVSGLRVEWRPDDERFRIRPSGPSGTGTRGQPWREWLGHSDMAVGASGPIPQDPEATWWAVWGEYIGNDVQVTLNDQSRPEVLVFGKLWICEGRGREREATVVTAGRQAEIRFAPPLAVGAGRVSANGSRDPSHIETPTGFHEMSGRT
ncbi:hypothetical protein GFY24_13185 [Nocardia sp. SYP-A9097]|uniref:hypothetical protein n=1 Tax=Nocardia sp. SYP-A9097 TaxID=2663237 RepID=UPI00129B765B|nr:hypothetical protein [Nocardia sp. SYP-A9097]MRH88387.1 hypothetical protein [Nocardia sp. SYP-A9097]